MEDKIVEIARFYEPEEAQILESLLKSEGIKCYLRNEYTSQVMYPANMGGIRVELLESEVPRAMEIMEANGYEFPKEDEEILPPAELLADYYKKRAALDHEIDKTLAEIQKILGIKINIENHED